MRGPHESFLLLTVLLLLAAGPAAAAAPELLVDIDPSGVDEDDNVGVGGFILSLGRVALASIAEESNHSGIWVTDGTDAGTRPLPAVSGSDPVMGAAGSTALFFKSENGQHSLWRTDGTRSRTFPLVPGKWPCRQDAVPFGRELLLVMADLLAEDHPCELWKTDGTVAGTVRVSDVDLRGDVSALAASDGRAFFSRTGPEGGELWTSDGTPEGTIRLRQWPSSDWPIHLTPVGRRLFFIAPDDGLELWTSDGTPGGTRPLTHFVPADPFVPRFDFPGNYVVQALDDRLAFLANDETAGRELWVSDGTAAGTRPATAFPVVSPFLGLDVWRVEKLAGRLVFPANDGTSGNRLWTSNGKPDSMAPISGCANGCPDLAPRAEAVRQGAQLAFVGALDESELWVTDGTGRGTRRLVSARQQGGVSNLYALLGRVFFAAEPNGSDPALFTTDETLSATKRLTTLDEAALPQPVVLGEIALLALSAFSSGWELWRSDGTPEGTFQVTQTGQTGQSSEVIDFVPAGASVRFLAYDGEQMGLWTSRGTAATTTVLTEHPVQLTDRLVPLGPLTLLLDADGQVWRSDGTAAGTFQLTSFDDGEVEDVAPLTTGRAVLARRMRNSSDSYDSSIWTTDGSLAGTRKVLDLPGEWRFRSDGPAGRETFFVVGSTAGLRLWVSDGTAAGTRAVTGSRPASIPIESPLQAVRLGSVVFFVGDDDSSGIALWRSDGTEAGTWPLAAERASNPEALLEYRGRLYFFATDVESRAIGLWRSDGTEAGTILLHSLRFQHFSFLPELVPFGDLLVFAAWGEENGVELWRTDGTAAGTVQVHDINPGSASSDPSDLTVLGDRLYFTASDRSHGTELWESDGTAAGTRLVQDIAPEVESSWPGQLTAAGGRLYFTAYDGVHGYEPWVYAPGGASCVPSDTALCLRGGRFRVEADWRDFEDHSGRGHAVALTADTGYFWFFDAANVEVILKILDGGGVNGHHWVFYGALSTVEYSLTVTDTVTGATRRYTNLPGRLGSVADTEAFGPNGASAEGGVTTGPAPELGEAIVASRTTEATQSCAPSATRLCLNGGRFAVEARWKAQGQSGTGNAVQLPGGDTGYFWFFDANNVEVVLKVLDGRPLNGKYWVFYGALSDVEYTLTVTDTETGTVRTYTNPSGRLASVADTGAF